MHKYKKKKSRTMKTPKAKSDCTVMLNPVLAEVVGLGIGVFINLASLTSAQTMVSGNICGTWSPSGNPYILTDNAYVPAGCTLTIQPGVVVDIGSGLTITNNGSIQAAGAPSAHIEFQAPVSSQYWNSII